MLWWPLSHTDRSSDSTEDNHVTRLTCEPALHPGGVAPGVTDDLEVLPSGLGAGVLEAQAAGGWAAPVLGPRVLGCEMDPDSVSLAWRGAPPWHWLGGEC